MVSIHHLVRSRPARAVGLTVALAAGMLSSPVSAAPKPVIRVGPGQAGWEIGTTQVGRDLASGDFNGNDIDSVVTTSLDPSGAIQIAVFEVPSLQHYAVDSGDDRTTLSFGEELAVGDFDNDGFEDLVLSDPGFSPLVDQTVLDEAGEVHVIPGSASGLDASLRQRFSQDGAVEGTLEANDRFGERLAVGDFNNDGYDDLLVGVPAETVGAVVGAGAVNVIFGSADGLAIGGNQILSQAGAVPGLIEAGDGFGSALTTGDFNNDGYDDAAISVPYEDIGTDRIDAGIAQIFFGSADGVSTDGVSTVSQLGDYPGAAETGDRFGFSLTAADFNGDALDDLAVGVPFESIGSGATEVIDGGVAMTFLAGGEGFDAANTTLLSQRGPIRGASETNDRFGLVVFGADLDEDGFAELFVGVPDEGIDEVAEAGLVHALRGSPTGISTDRDVILRDESAEVGARFGATILAGATDSFYKGALIAAVDADLNSQPDSGAVSVFLSVL